MELSGETTARGIGAVRIAMGAAAWLAPRASARALGIEPGDNAQLAYVMRIVGIRDVALGAGVLGCEREARSRWLAAGAACDASDALATAFGTLRGALPRVPATAMTLGAAAFAMAGLAASRRSM